MCRATELGTAGARRDHFRFLPAQLKAEPLFKDVLQESQCS